MIIGSFNVLLMHAWYLNDKVRVSCMGGWVTNCLDQNFLEVIFSQHRVVKLSGLTVFHIRQAICFGWLVGYLQVVLQRTGGVPEG